MSIEQGLLWRGRVVPGTDWVLRDSSAWYTRGDDDVFVRSEPVELLTFHWTAGPRRAGLVAAQKTYRAMQARRKDNGEEMSVSAQFVLADDGALFQLADLELGCFHAHREFNRRGIGIEWTSPGTETNANRLGVPEKGERRTVAGSTVMALRPSPAALATALRFAELCVNLPQPAFNVARFAHTRRERFGAHEIRRARGVVEHYHATGTTKVDAAGFFVDHLAAAGWPHR
jgi:hypothetical protein